MSMHEAETHTDGDRPTRKPNTCMTATRAALLFHLAVSQSVSQSVSLPLRERSEWQTRRANLLLQPPKHFPSGASFSAMFLASRFLVFALVLLTLRHARTQPEEPIPAILGGIGNVATSATNFLTGIMRRQKELIHRVTDTASDYISSAVEKPRNLLINATRATTGIIDSATSKGLEFKLRRFLEKFRGRMRYGIPELGIPPLEPLQLDEIDVGIDNPEIGNVTLVIENLVLHNLSTFVINRAKLSLIGPTITANLTVPHLHAEGLYNISGVLGNMVKLFGDGPFKADIYDFQIYVNTVLGYSRGMYLKTFDLDFNLRSLDVRLENFMGDEEISRIMSKVFQELTPKVVDIIKPDVLPEIQDYIAGRVNETIHHLTMRDVFSVLVGQNEIRDFADLLVL